MLADIIHNTQHTTSSPGNLSIHHHPTPRTHHTHHIPQSSSPRPVAWVCYCFCFCFAEMQMKMQCNTSSKQSPERHQRYQRLSARDGKSHFLRPRPRPRASISSLSLSLSSPRMKHKQIKLNSTKRKSNCNLDHRSPKCEVARAIPVSAKFRLRTFGGMGHLKWPTQS
jgi:hypothetical protein